MIKKICLLFSLVALTFSAMAQDKSADEYKNEGNEFVRNKRFQQALESYQQALKLWGDSVDQQTVFNAGICAEKTKDLDLAISYFTQCKEAGFKEPDAAYRIALLLKKQKKTDEYKTAVEAGYETYKNGKTGNLFKKELAKIYRDEAMGIFNEGADVTKQMQSASGAKLDELKAQAKAKFREAMTAIDKSLDINPDDANAKTVKQNIEKQLAAF